MGNSRVENILQAWLTGDPYDTPPYSRVEKLLIDLKNSGGGGGTNDYNQLINKPSINGHILIGDKTAEELELVRKTAGGNTYDPSDEDLFVDTDGTNNTYDSDDESALVIIGGAGNTYSPEDESVIIGG